MFKNIATKIALFAFDTTTGAPKTGDAANLTAYVSKDYGTVTALADTTATEMDATNAKGWYIFDVAQAETNADALLFTGKSSTANVSVVGQYIHTTPNHFSGLVIDSSGLADATAVKVGPSGAAISTAKLAAHIPAILQGVAAAGGSTTTIVLNSSTGIDGGVPSATDDFYNGAAVVFTSGALAGQRTGITDYVGSTKTLTVATMTGAPSAGDTFIIV